MNQFFSFLKRHADILLPVFAALLVLAVFSSSLDFRFLHDWDDGEYIISNTHLNLTAANLLYWFRNPIQDLYTPLQILSFMIEKTCFGLILFCNQT